MYTSFGRSFALVLSILASGVTTAVAAPPGGAPSTPPASGTRVTLHVKEVSAQQVLEEIERATGVAFEVPARADADRLIRTPVTVDADGAPLWSVVLKVCEAAGVRPISFLADRPGVTLAGGNAGAWNARSTAIQGAFAVSLIRVEQSAQAINGGRGGAGSQEVTVVFQICPEPGAHAQPAAKLDVARCLDERGFPVAVQSFRPFQPPSIPLTAALRLRADGVTRISVLEGSATIPVETAWQKVEVPIAAAAGSAATRDVEGVRLTFAPLARPGPRQWEQEVVISPTGRSATDAAEVVNRLWSSSPSLQDAQGKRLILNGRGVKPRKTAEGFAVRFSFIPVNRLGRDMTGEPVKLVWDVPTRTAEVKTPFTFKDVALPGAGATAVARGGGASPAAPAAPPKRAQVADALDEPAPDYSKRVTELVAQLAAVSAADRQTAEIRLALLPPAAFPLIEAASKRPDLSPAAAPLLRKLVERQRPWQAARLHRAKVLEEGCRWERQISLDAYRSSGTRDPKWDTAAERAISLFCQPEDVSRLGGTRAAFEKAIEAGCDDPLVLGMAAFTFERSGVNPNDVLKLYARAHDGMMSRNYPAYSKLWLAIRFYSLTHRIRSGEVEWKKLDEFDPETNRILNRTLREMLTYWPGVARQGGPPARLMETALRILSIHSSQKNIETVYRTLAPSLAAATPDAPGLLVLKGAYHVHWAWEARGSGTADTVTEEGWRLFRERLAIAEDALTEAYKKDPTDPLAPTEMLTVALGRNQPRDVMETWYRRATAADPDGIDAPVAKANYLEPKWHGSVADVRRFVDELIQRGNWRGRLPAAIAHIQWFLALDTDDPPAYLRGPRFWADISRVFEPYLRAQPDDVDVRSTYCYFACMAERWDVARKQFETLGDNVMIQFYYFNTVEQMTELRHKAESAGRPKGGS